MPELPEVETIRRQLEPELVGQRIEELRVHDERWARPEPAEALAELIEGRRIESVARRGKYLIVGVEGDRFLVMHLRMTGNLLIADRDLTGALDGETGGRGAGARKLGGPRLYEPPPGARYLRAELLLDDGRRVWFTDPRRFGHAVALNGPELEDYLSERLGIEPLSADLTDEAIGELTAGRTAPLKSFLLTQQRIAGIGNIYADEALHRAGLHPLSPAGSTRPPHWARLREGIVESLERGIALGGASIDDYRDANGQEGEMQAEFLVHTREGDDCPRCGDEIRRIVVSGRSTYFCGSCQTRLRRRKSRAS
ncbi:MAG: bifunctional DNA-formamidopyrimidine glycosylase/DNA-(apurinic or apyrimidinic site) lyase [Solirubrobacterales bacterium]